MVRLAWIIFAIVFALNYLLRPLARLWPDPAAAWRALDYVGQGLAGALQWAIVAALIHLVRAHCAERFRAGSTAALAACFWGLFEESARPACRLLYPLGAPPPNGDRGLCDYALGVHVTSVVLAILLVVLYRIATRSR